MLPSWRHAARRPADWEEVAMFWTARRLARSLSLVTGGLLVLGACQAPTASGPSAGGGGIASAPAPVSGSAPAPAVEVPAASVAPVAVEPGGPLEVVHLSDAR